MAYRATIYRKLVCCLLWAVCVVFAVGARADMVIEEARLANGMKVIVVPNPMVPAVTHMVWYRVGGMDDPVGKSGLAHFFEHMMFKATKNHPANAFPERVAELGGEDNAFTSHDYTAYYQTVAKEHLAEMMRWESERMQHIVFDAAEVAREKQVILEERAMRTESNVHGLLAEQMRAALFVNHPYGQPVIGWAEEIKAISAADLREFYQQTLKPANALLVVAGDTTMADVLPLAKRYYGGIPSGVPLVRPQRPEPAARAERFVLLRHEQVKQKSWQRWYLAPSQTAGQTADAYALSLLAQLLGGGQTSFLYQELVEKRKLASAISAGYDDVSAGPGIFTIRATPLPGVTMQALGQAVDALLQQWLRGGISDVELSRAQRLFTTQATYAREGLNTMPTIVGTVWAAGLPMQYIHQWTGRIQQVKAADVAAAAERLLRPEASVTGWLLPEPAAAPSPQAAGAKVGTKVSTEAKEACHAS